MLERMWRKSLNSYTAGGNAKLYSQSGQFGSFLKNKHATVTSNSTTGYLPLREINLCSHKNLHMIVHSSLICNSQRPVSAEMSFNR